MNRTLIRVLVLTLAISCVSCDPSCYNNVSIIINNEINKEIITFVEFPYEPYLNHKDTIPANKLNYLLTQYSTGPSIGPATNIAKIWLYNPNDSKYIIITNFKQNGNENCIFDEIEPTIDFTNKGRNGSLNYTTEFVYIINDSLLNKMTKNTSITDSIFSLKKKY